MKKLIVLIFVSGIALAGNSSPETSPTKTGYTRKKAYGQLRYQRNNFYKKNGKKKNRKIARKLFTTEAILADRAR